MKNNIGKFNQKANVYSSGRPTYASAFIDALYSEYGFSDKSIVADVGSGTGIFTRQLLEKGSAVYAVEPNADMRKKAESELGAFKNFHSIIGAAEHTTLKKNSVDFITTAQAFHWFEIVSFKNECVRILKPHGKVFLIWNMRNPATDINVEQYEIFKKYCPDFIGFNGGIKENDERIRAFFDDDFSRIEFDNPLIYHREKFIKRSLSGSYSLTENDKNYPEYFLAINALFDKHAVRDAVTIPNKTVVYFNKHQLNGVN